MKILCMNCKLKSYDVQVSQAREIEEHKFEEVVIDLQSFSTYDLSSHNQLA